MAGQWWGSTLYGTLCIYNVLELAHLVGGGEGGGDGDARGQVRGHLEPRAGGQHCTLYMVIIHEVTITDNPVPLGKIKDQYCSSEALATLGIVCEEEELNQKYL